MVLTGGLVLIIKWLLCSERGFLGVLRKARLSGNSCWKTSLPPADRHSGPISLSEDILGPSCKVNNRLAGELANCEQKEHNI